MTGSYLWDSPAVIEGIGEVHENSLREAGIATIADLLKYTAGEIQKMIPRTSLRQIVEWFASASLLRVEGVTPDMAEALIDAGIDSEDALAEAGLQTLERAVKKAKEARKLKGDVPSLYALAAIQREAWRIRGRGIVLGSVTNASANTPLSGMTVRAAGRTTQTDAEGRFCFIDLPEGEIWLALRLRHAELTLPVIVKAGRVSGPVTIRIEMPPVDESEPAVYRESDGYLVTPTGGARVRFETVELGEIDSDAYLQVRYYKRDGTVRLLNLYRSRIGPEVIAEHVYVQEEQLPDSADVGTILHYQDGILNLTALTPQDIARKKFEAVMGNVELRPIKRLVPALPGKRGDS